MAIVVLNDLLLPSDSRPIRLSKRCAGDNQSGTRSRLAALLVANYRRIQKNETAAPGRVTAVINTDEGTVDADTQRTT